MKYIREKSWFKAGEILAKLILKELSQFFCFAILNGGLPVVEGF